jgi:hypothetical protein
MGKRLGSLIPMALMLLFVAISYYTGMVRELVLLFYYSRQEQA